MNEPKSKLGEALAKALLYFAAAGFGAVTQHAGMPDNSEIQNIEYRLNKKIQDDKIDRLRDDLTKHELNHS